MRKLLSQMAEIQAEQVAARIAQARRESGITQEEMADLLGISTRGYQAYEADRIPFRRLDQIAEITGTTKRWLLHGDESETTPLDRVSSSEMLDAINALTRELKRANDRRDEFEGRGGSVAAGSAE